MSKLIGIILFTLFICLCLLILLYIWTKIDQINNNVWSLKQQPINICMWVFD